MHTRGESGAALDFAAVDYIMARDAVEVLREAPWHQKSYGTAAAACDFLTHPVENSAERTKDNNAGASTASPSVFSPCPSEAASPLLEPSCCFSSDESHSTSVMIASQWGTASNIKNSSCSIQNSSKSGKDIGGGSSSSSSRNGGSGSSIDIEEDGMCTPPASAPFKSVHSRAVAAAATPPQHLSAISRASTTAETAECQWENSSIASTTQASESHKYWQADSLLYDQQHAATAAGVAISQVSFAHQLLPECTGSSNSSLSDYRLPAPLEGGRTAATRDYYLGDETCMTPAAAAAAAAEAGAVYPTAAPTLLLPQQVVDPEQIGEKRIDKLQNPSKQLLLLEEEVEAAEPTQVHKEEWGNLRLEEEKRKDNQDTHQLEVRTITQQDEEDEEEEEEERGGPPLLLFPFLRKAKVLKIAINEVLLLQQQTGYLMLLQPPSPAPTTTTTTGGLPAAFCSSCNGGSSALERTLLMESSAEQVLDIAAAAAAGEKSSSNGNVSLCYNCELALHVNTAQQLLTRTHRVLQRMEQQQEEEEIRWQQEQQLRQQQSSSMTLFVEQMHQQHNTAASAAELRIRRSVLRQQHQQLQVALEQQQQLEDDLKARWETEVLADMQTLCPDRPQQELQHRLAQQLQASEEQQGSAAAAAWLLVESSSRSGGSTRTDASEEADAESPASTLATATAGGDLQAAEVVAVKCRQLQKLQASLLEVRSMMDQMQQQQLRRDEQIGCVEEATALTKQNTTDAVQDLLLARKYQRRAFRVGLIELQNSFTTGSTRHSLYLIGALAALFLFFFFPASPLVPLLFRLHRENPPPSAP